MNYDYTACCWFPTSSNILILPLQFWQIGFESYWLHCSKCRILVILRYAGFFIFHRGCWKVAGGGGGGRGTTRHFVSFVISPKFYIHGVGVALYITNLSDKQATHKANKKEKGEILFFFLSDPWGGWCLNSLTPPPPPPPAYAPGSWWPKTVTVIGQFNLISH